MKRFVVVIIINSALIVTGFVNRKHIIYSVIKFNFAYLMKLLKSEINLLDFNKM